MKRKNKITSNKKPAVEAGFKQTKKIYVVATFAVRGLQTAPITAPATAETAVNAATSAATW